MKMIESITLKLDKHFGEGNYILIAAAIGGSRAYGISRSDSDYDITGIVIPPKKYWLGTAELKGGVISVKDDSLNMDGTLFEFEKWFGLAIKQNPNCTEILWLEENQYLYRDEVIWPILMEYRDKLLIKALKHPYASYAFAQLNRLDKLNEKVNQNQKRLEEFKKFGYSTKNAAHLFRLLGMALDALVEHRHIVMRPDRQFLISIREGDYSYEDIRRMATDKYNLVEKAYIESTLPNNLDQDMLDSLKIGIYEKALEILNGYARKCYNVGKKNGIPGQTRDNENTISWY